MYNFMYSGLLAIFEIAPKSYIFMELAEGLEPPTL